MRLFREIIFDISEIQEHKNPFKIACKMMKGLRKGRITNAQYESLSDELLFQCEKNNISTTSEIGLDLF